MNSATHTQFEKAFNKKTFSNLDKRVLSSFGVKNNISKSTIEINVIMTRIFESPYLFYWRE